VVEARVLEMRRLNPGRGPRTILNRLAREKVEPVPSRPAIYRALRHQLIYPTRDGAGPVTTSAWSASARWSCGGWTSRQSFASKTVHGPRSTPSNLQVTSEPNDPPGEAMTDLLDDDVSVPSRLGVTAEYRDGELKMELRPRAEVLRQGVVRASVLAFMIDVVAGVVLDDDPNVWSLTSDLSVRMRPILAPNCIQTWSTILRRGRRSSTAQVDLTTPDGKPVATGAIGFVRVPRRDTEPPKPLVSLESIAASFDGSNLLTRPLREEAGVAVLDPTQGEVQMQVTPELLNSAGTLQGAMVALLSEAAAEDLVSARFDAPAVVTDLDLRYLAQTGSGPVRTKCRLLGAGPEAPVEVELRDISSGRLTSLVYARTAVIAK
jgi:acyl-coenzyme A thioesterase PaaI-like protein